MVAEICLLFDECYFLGFVKVKKKHTHTALGAKPCEQLNMIERNKNNSKKQWAPI